MINDDMSNRFHFQATLSHANIGFSAILFAITDPDMLGCTKCHHDDGLGNHSHFHTIFIQFEDGTIIFNVIIKRNLIYEKAFVIRYTGTETKSTFKIVFRLVSDLDLTYSITSLMTLIILATQLGYSAGECQALQLIVLAVFGVVD